MISTDPDPATRPASMHTPFLPRLPYHVVWLATNACNARCVHCSSDAAKRLPGELTTEEARRMFADLARLGIFDVAVSGGEPLTRPDIFEVMEFARSQGIRIGLGSNGSTITPKVVERLKRLGLDRLQISIDGLPETHDRARRWPGLFARSRRAIKLGVEGGLRVHVCFTAHRMNHTELPELIDQAVEWGIRRFNMSRLVPTGRGDAALDLTPAEWERLVAVFEEKRREYRDRIDFSTHLAQLVLAAPELTCDSGFIGCQAGIGQGCIDSLGNVSPCVMLPVPLGNIREQSFDDLWENSPVTQSLRERSSLRGACGSCDLRDRCGGCRGVAYAYTGDYLATDPRCWRWPGTAMEMLPEGPASQIVELRLPAPSDVRR